MFVRYYLDLPVAFEDAEASLLDDPGTWVPGMLEAAEDRGERLLAEVGFGVDTRRIDKQIEIGLGEPYRLTSKTLLPMTWRAAGPERLRAPGAFGRGAGGVRAEDSPRRDPWPKSGYFERAA